ncbi:GAF domain-containing protein [Mycobacterium sp. BK558]|nr:GAF domain-containing protein [Mycobacterium sp. BK558]
MDPTSSGRLSRDDQLELMTRRLIAAERRAQTLAELNRLLAQGRDPLPFAQRAVDLVMRATGASGTYVYLWDSQLERLVLRVSTTGSQAAHVDEIALRLGEGVTGWSALMRQTVVIHDDLHTDPRFAPVAILDEERFRSMVAVPIVVSGGDVLGVFSLWSTSPSTFAPHDVDLATEVGGLLASGLLQARTVEDLRRQSAAARFLLTVPSEAASSLQRCLDVLSASIREQVDATLCTIELADRASAEAPARPGVALHSGLDPTLTVTARAVRSRADLADLVQRLGPGLDKFSTSFGQLFPLGAITCYRGRPFSESDVNIIEALSAQTAALVASFSNPSLATPLAGRLANAANEQEAERLLHDLGWRRGRTQAVVVRTRASHYGSPGTFDRILGSLEEVCRSFDDILIVPSAPTASLLIRHQPEQWRKFENTLRGVCRSLRTEAGVVVSVGIGSPATEASQLLDALDNAETAALWADLLDEPIVHHQDVAHLKMLPKVALNAGDGLRETLNRFNELARYDLRHGTALSETLDAYMANGCSITDTAAALFIHRNTLRQRLGRIDELTGRSTESAADWTIIALAARLSLANSAPELVETRPGDGRGDIAN